MAERKSCFSLVYMYLNLICLLWPVLSPLWCFTVLGFSSLSLFLPFSVCLSVCLSFALGSRYILFCLFGLVEKQVCIDEHL